jgi:hypothetical protein
MAYTRSAVAPHDLAFTETSSVKRASGPSIWSRLFATVKAARMRQAEREIARYLYGNGGKFTDEAEREIERRFLANDRRW